MEHDILISICMMVKDEEKNLGRCLDAMSYMLEKKDVELIIIDTGSKDRSAGIAREYTDKVYFHPWGNNFSEMRNVTISYAKGKYILIMDADEVLTDAALLYEYISDERLKEYNTFIVKIKNFESSGGYTVLPQERVFKNDGSFRYEGAVHNQPKFKKPVLNTDIYLDHYGYLFHDKELREKKFLRTAGILRRELEKNPDNPYYRFQLARSYSAHRDKKEAYEEICKAYQLISVSKETQKSYIYVYGTYSIISLENNEFDEAIRACREGLEIRPEYLDLYYLMAAAYAKIGRNEEAQDAYENYSRLVKQYDKLAISSDRSIEMYYIGEKYQDAAYIFLANNFYRKGKYNECYDYTVLIHDDKTKSERMAKVLLKLSKYDELKSLYVSNIKNNTIRETIESLIEAEAAQMNADSKKKMHVVFGDGDEQYSVLNRIRISEGEERQQLISEAMRKLNFSELPDYYADILADIDKNVRPVISVLKRLRKAKIKQFIKRLVENDRGLEDFFEHYLLNESIRADDHNSLRIYICIAYVMLLLRAVEARDARAEPSDQYNKIFEKYVKYGFYYSVTLYSQERLRLHYSTLEDREDSFFIALNYACEACEKGDFRAGAKYFRDAARANAYLACYMKKYKDELFKDLSNIDNEVEIHE